jgi:hypothetical protein
MSVRYSIKFNGTLVHSFEPLCGLRQGDPLSSFIFLFTDDGLSSLLNKDINQNTMLSPIKVCYVLLGCHTSYSWMTLGRLLLVYVIEIVIPEFSD